MDTIYGFELVREQQIPELNTKASYYRHLKTGAELLSLENDDENKVFGIIFRTPPQDSTGVPHIMEHSVLCGSNKYPLKEPFVELLKGSLKTFLNAFTYPDKTCYPLASQNLKDFYNLIDVYIDAVFHPLIPAHILEQEGWHYELENRSDPLNYKGVVFNEMKGAYSSPDNLLMRWSQQSLFPDNAYGVDSGGDPRVIPDLTYAQFKAFHETYYHPSNARIFFAGDDPPLERLRLMDAYLREFDARQVHSTISLQPSFSHPKKIAYQYDPGESAAAQKAMLTVNWLLPEMKDPELVLAFQILAHTLLATPASPLRKALLDSGLGEDLAGVGLEDELRQMYFSAGMKGVAPEDTAKVETLIIETLQSLAGDGLDKDTVAASMNTIEFRLRENNTGSFPRGLLLMLRSLTTWLHDEDPITPLAFEAPLNNLKAHLAGEPRYFEELIRLYLLENKHRTTVVMNPKSGLRDAQDAEEIERLNRLKEGFTSEDLEQIIENTRYLKQRQETPDPPEMLAKIPVLSLDDLDRQIRHIPLEVHQVGGSEILYHDLFTNGIVYLDVGFDLHALPAELLPYVPLFGLALTGMGTTTESYVQLAQRIGQKTGGIWSTPFTAMQREAGRSVARLFLRGKALTGQAGDLLAIMKDILLTSRLDDQTRFRQILLEEKSGEEAGLAPSGHQVVNTRLRAQFTEAGWVAEKMGGIDYLFFLRELLEKVNNDWAGVQADLERLRDLLIHQGAMVCNVTVDRANWTVFEPQLKTFVSTIPQKESRSFTWQRDPRSIGEGLAFPAQVNYVGKGIELYHGGYSLDGSIYTILKHLRTAWLWDQVRVQGGAYGALLQFDHRSGVLTYLSYRDPNIINTLAVYDRTGKYLADLKISQEEVVKNIIGAIGDLDAHLLPDAKGFRSMVRYLAGDSDEFRQRLRDELLDTKTEDFRALGEHLQKITTHAPVVVLGSEAAIAEANTTYPDLLAVTRVL